jgi:hypothetical protein
MRERKKENLNVEKHKLSGFEFTALFLHTTLIVNLLEKLKASSYRNAKCRILLAQCKNLKFNLKKCDKTKNSSFGSIYLFQHRQDGGPIHNAALQ